MKPAPIIMMILAVLLGGALFVGIVVLLALAWIETLFMTAPLLGVALVGGGLLVCGGTVWLLRAGYRRYLA